MSDVDRILDLMKGLADTVSLQIRSIEDLKRCIEALAARVNELEREVVK